VHHCRHDSTRHDRGTPPDAARSAGSSLADRSRNGFDHVCFTSLVPKPVLGHASAPPRSLWLARLRGRCVLAFSGYETDWHWRTGSDNETQPINFQSPVDVVAFGSLGAVSMVGAVPSLG